MPITRRELRNLRSLRTKKGRAQAGLFAAEGTRLLEEAIRQRVFPESLYWVPEELKAREVDLVEKFRSSGVFVKEIDRRELLSVTNTETPQGALAVFPLPAVELASAYRKDDLRIVVGESISDPGNLGTLIRSALAFEFSLIVLTGSSADPHAPKVVRSTAGAIFGVRVARASNDELLRLLGTEGFRLVATSGGGRTDREPSERVVPADRIAVAIGSENEGLSSEILEQSDFTWSVPHCDKVESLNAAVAGSIVLKEIYDGNS